MPVKTPSATEAPDLTVRLPVQRRGLQTWRRILDAGVGVLERDGYEGFTIAAVCQAGGVPPRAVYDRVRSKEGLFLAVYEHGMARVVASHSGLADDAGWVGLTPDAAVRRAVAEVLGTFTQHAALLRAVVLTSGAHPEVLRRGGAFVAGLGELFAARVAEAAPGASRRMLATAFRAVFATCVLRVAYGAGFAGPAEDDGELADALAELVAPALAPQPRVAAE